MDKIPILEGYIKIINLTNKTPNILVTSDKIRATTYVNNIRTTLHQEHHNIYRTDNTSNILDQNINRRSLSNADVTETHDHNNNVIYNSGRNMDQQNNSRNINISNAHATSSDIHRDNYKSSSSNITRNKHNTNNSSVTNVDQKSSSNNDNDITISQRLNATSGGLGIGISYGGFGFNSNGSYFNQVNSMDHKDISKASSSSSNIVKQNNTNKEDLLQRGYASANTESNSLSSSNSDQRSSSYGYDCTNNKITDMDYTNKIDLSNIKATHDNKENATSLDTTTLCDTNYNSSNDVVAQVKSVNITENKAIQPVILEICDDIINIDIPPMVTQTIYVRYRTETPIMLRMSYDKDQEQTISCKENSTYIISEVNNILALMLIKSINKYRIKTIDNCGWLLNNNKIVHYKYYQKKYNDNNIREFYVDIIDDLSNTYTKWLDNNIRLVDVDIDKEQYNKVDI